MMGPAAVAAAGQHAVVMLWLGAAVLLADGQGDAGAGKKKCSRRWRSKRSKLCACGHEMQLPLGLLMTWIWSGSSCMAGVAGELIS